MTIFLIWRSLTSLVILCLSIESRILLELPEPFPRRLSGRVLEIPKSHSFTWQSLFINMLAGFKSRCMIFAEWQNFIEHKRLYNINLICPWEIPVKTPYLIIFFKSESSSSITMKMFFSVWIDLSSGGTTMSKSSGIKQHLLYFDDSWSCLII